MEIKDVIWKPIPGYPYYEASNRGEIRSIDKPVAHNYGGTAIKKGKVLSKYISSEGYYRVGVTVNKRTEAKNNSILTCLAWHPNPENKRTVNHKDTDKLNDNEWNLEWNTDKENTQHAIVNKCRKSPYRLTDEMYAKIGLKRRKQVVVIDELTKEVVAKESISNVASILKVTQSAVSHSLRRKNLILKRYKVNLIESGLAIDASTIKK